MKSSNITEAKDINEERQNLINSKAQLERFVNDKQASFHVGCNLNSTYRLTIPRYAVQDLINRCYAHAMNELEDRAKAIGLELE